MGDCRGRRRKLEMRSRETDEIETESREQESEICIWPDGNSETFFFQSSNGAKVEQGKGERGVVGGRDPVQ